MEAFVSHKNILQRFLDPVILMLWFILFMPVLQWLVKSSLPGADPIRMVLGVALSVFLLPHFFRQRKAGLVLFNLSFKPLPVVVLISGILGYLYAEQFFALHLFSTVFWGVATYGLAGLYLPSPLWKRGTVFALFALLLLPLDHSLDVYLGFPLRLLSTHWVQQALSLFHTTVLSQETILRIENEATQIDVACSGLKGLWSGWICFLAMSWIQKKSLNLFWIFSLLLFTGVLFCANLIRITLIVITSHVLHQPALASFIHLPLGVIGFVFSCLCGYGLMKLGGRSRLSPLEPLLPFNRRPKALVSVLLIFIFSVGIFYKIRHPFFLTEPKNIVSDIAWPDGFFSETLALTDKERLFFSRQGGAEALIKKRFSWKGLHGSLWIVSASSFRPHHDPTLCLRGNGLTLDAPRTLLVDPSFPIRFTTLNNQTQAASFWFQSGRQVTEDFSARVWADLIGPSHRWQLVSLLFDRPPSLETLEFKEFHRELRKAIWKSFGG